MVNFQRSLSGSKILLVHPLFDILLAWDCGNKLSRSSEHFDSDSENAKTSWSQCWYVRILTGHCKNKKPESRIHWSRGKKIHKFWTVDDCFVVVSVAWVSIFVNFIYHRSLNNVYILNWLSLCGHEIDGKEKGSGQLQSLTKQQNDDCSNIHYTPYKAFKTVSRKFSKPSLQRKQKWRRQQIF